METLERQAYLEAKANVGMLTPNSGKKLTPDQFEGLHATDKETVIRVLGNAGLVVFNTDIEKKTITVECSELITKVQACTVFSVLNRLEKLDGALNVLVPGK